MTPTTPRVAFVGFGEVSSPKEVIERKCREAHEALEKLDLKVTAISPVSDDEAGTNEARARNELATAQFDLIVVCIAGWIPSQTVLNVVDGFRSVPMVLWGLTGHYENDRLITTADQAGTSALRAPMEALGYKFTYVYDTPDEPLRSANRIGGLARVAQAANRLRRARIGMMGYRDMNLYATLVDQISLRRVVGPEIESFDMLEVVQNMERVSARDAAEVVTALRSDWIFDRPVSNSTLDTGARMYLAIRRKVDERGYEAVSLTDVYGAKKLLHFPPGMVMMLLTDLGGIASIPENDVAGSVTQLVVRYLSGQVAAYFEIYEFFRDRVLVGVPDYVPAEIVDGRVHVVPWPGFGGLTEGLLNVSQVRTGPITLCRLGGRGSSYRMHVVTGHAAKPRSWEEAGWEPPAPQLPSLEITLDTPVETFAQQVLGQHYIIAYGDHRQPIADLCRLLDIELS